MLQRDLERDVIPYARYANLGIVPYFPLAGGLLTGKYKRGDEISATRANYVTPFLTEKNFQILDQLRAFVAAAQSQRWATWQLRGCSASRRSVR